MLMEKRIRRGNAAGLHRPSRAPPSSCLEWRAPFGWELGCPAACDSPKGPLALQKLHGATTLGQLQSSNPTEALPPTVRADDDKDLRPGAAPQRESAESSLASPTLA